MSGQRTDKLVTESHFPHDLCKAVLWTFCFLPGKRRGNKSRIADASDLTKKERYGRVRKKNFTKSKLTNSIASTHWSTCPAERRWTAAQLFTRPYSKSLPPSRPLPATISSLWPFLLGQAPSPDQSLSSLWCLWPPPPASLAPPFLLTNPCSPADHCIASPALPEGELFHVKGMPSVSMWTEQPWVWAARGAGRSALVAWARLLPWPGSPSPADKTERWGGGVKTAITSAHTLQAHLRKLA